MDAPLGVPSPFFPGILLSSKLPETQGKRIRFLERRMVAKNGQGNHPVVGNQLFSFWFLKADSLVAIYR